MNGQVSAALGSTSNESGPALVKYTSSARPPKEFDWYYIDYRFWDWLGIRMGRTKIPFGLYNEVNDIDAARVPILLPQSVYPATSRDISLAQTGGELYGYVSLSAAGALEYRAYGGTIFVDPDTIGGGFTNLDVPYMFGGRLMWSPPSKGSRSAAACNGSGSN